jgi:hypothetical protein
MKIFKLIYWHEILVKPISPLNWQYFSLTELPSPKRFKPKKENIETLPYKKIQPTLRDKTPKPNSDNPAAKSFPTLPNYL